MHLSNDRVHTLTKDAAGRVVKWNIVTAQPVADYGTVDFAERVCCFTIFACVTCRYFMFSAESQAQVKAEEVLRSVPAWCSLDVKLGRLTVSLEDDCYAAWTLGALLGEQFVQDEKYNIGLLVLQALLHNWILATVDASESSRVKVCGVPVFLVHFA